MAYENAIKGKVTIDLRIVRFNNIGLPRSGKTSFRKRMMKLIRNIQQANANIGKEEPSTKISERKIQIIRKTCAEIGMVSSKHGVWSVVKGEEEEAKILNELIDYIMNKPLPSSAAQPFGASSPGPVAAQNIQTQPRGPVAAHNILTAEHGVEKSHIAADITKGEDIEEMFAFLNKDMKESDWGKVKHLLEDLILIINSDMGGQAEFLALYGSLVSGPSFNLLFRRLTDKLEEAFQVYYTDEHGKSTERVRSPMTVEEVVFQALASIAGYGGSFSDDKSVPKSKVMFVGTHLDWVTDAKIAAEVRERDELLKQKVKQSAFYKKRGECLVEFASYDKLTFEVNNQTGEDDEIEPIRRKLESVMEDNFPRTKIPIAWLVLNLCIRSTKLRIMPLSDCEKLAQKLNIGSEELKDALKFLHHFVGLLLYYPEGELKALCDTVICDIQIVFDSASNLIKSIFDLEIIKDHRACRRFRETAQFSLCDVEKAMGSNTDVLPLPKLVQLLEHLNILTPLSAPKEQGNADPSYFMPCVLRNATADELKVARSDSDPAPLMLRYECGYVPFGVFPAMITNLFSRQEELGWEMIDEGGVLRKNKVQFSVGRDCDMVTLISRPRYFEITITRQTDCEDHEKSKSSLCSEILAEIEFTHRIVTSKMNYNFSMGYHYGFECPKPQTRNHICIVVDKSARRMKCLQDVTGRTTFPLDESHRVWFQKHAPAACSSRKRAETPGMLSGGGGGGGGGQYYFKPTPTSTSHKYIQTWVEHSTEDHYL